MAPGTLRITPEPLSLARLRAEALRIFPPPAPDAPQAKGTWHFRTTFLPPESDIDGVVEAMTKFHGEFMAEYR